MWYFSKFTQSYLNRIRQKPPRLFQPPPHTHSNNLSIKPSDKLNYEQTNPIDWSEQKCVLCNFKLDIMPTSAQTANFEMTYGDFYIRQEHKSIRSIYC